MDEISLKRHLFYDLPRYRLVDLETYGDGGSSGIMASSGVVLMIRQILHTWKQPVAFYLASESCPSSKLKEVIDEAIFQLESIGLTMLALVHDQGSTFYQFVQELGVTPGRPFFEMRGKQYFTIFDPPNLLKNVRNNLMKYSFNVNGKTAKWAHIKEFYNNEKKLAIRTAPTLTEKHIEPNWFQKMNVNLVSHVFSHSVAAGLFTNVALNGLPSEAVGTAELLERIDKIVTALLLPALEATTFPVDQFQ